MTDYAIRHGDVVTSLKNLAAPGIGDVFALPPQPTDVARIITWSFEITGGPPATIQVDLEGSLDRAAWYQLDTSAVVGSVLRHVSNKPVKFVRLNLISIGAGGGTVLGRIYIE